jgi:hypothetical protein
VQTILKKQFVQIEAPGGAGSNGSATPRVCEKRVDVLRVDGIVRALEVTCSCGEKSVVELDYAENKE